MSNNAEKVQSVGMAGPDRKHAAIHRLGLGQAAGALMRDAFLHGRSHGRSIRRGKSTCCR